MPHISAAKLWQIENIEQAIIDTADPVTPETGLARFLANLSDITDRQRRHDLYTQIVDGPGLTSEEKAWVKIIRIFDAETKTREDRTQIMSDVAQIVVAEDADGKPVTAADVLEYTASMPDKGRRVFESIGRLLTRENAELLAPLLAIIYPKTAIYLVAYALRNVPQHIYKAAVADTPEDRGEEIRAVFRAAASGLRNSGPLVKPAAWLGLKFPLFWEKIVNLGLKDGIKQAVDTLSSKKKMDRLYEFFEAGAQDPVKFLNVLTGLREYFGSKSEVIATAAAVAVHAKFGNKGTLVLQELAERGFFDALLKGDKREAGKIKKEIAGAQEIVKELEYIRTHEETPEQRAAREYREAFYNKYVVIPGF